ncbi:hypothetical protein GW17_00049398 [Ensete ventricosum]|uniref:Uncharacterized protein n=1 Tax=Ensete ventricosum TaxID=4639 RepID=A0A444CRN7_ENSVE|nr:hypothetical protein GW17_00049398 [Ensete ventricosum]RZR73940.1 hypothetical protein BHM03_00029979 [Ensete ventricosum]
MSLPPGSRIPSQSNKPPTTSQQGLWAPSSKIPPLDAKNDRNYNKKSGFWRNVQLATPDSDREVVKGKILETSARLR